MTQEQKKDINMFDNIMFCKKCKDILPDGPCNCKEYHIFNPETMDEGDTRAIWAHSREEAAEKYAEREYNDDPCKVEDFKLEFFVGNRKFKATAQKHIIFNVDEE